MPQRTDIEWTDFTSNPVRFRRKDTGEEGWHCHKLSPGCAHCYSEVLDGRFGLKLPYQKRFAELVEPFLVEEELRKLARMRGGHRVFLEDMSDLFLDLVPDAMLDRVFATILASPRTTFQVLTKRIDRAVRYFRRSNQWGAAEAYRDLVYGPDSDVSLGDGLAHWPPRNMWLGVSVEDREHGLPRVDILRRIPARVRYLSIEPLLEELGAIDLTGIHWVIVGGESGRKARPMHPAWARSLRDQCVAAGVPFFFKQWGEWAPEGQSTPYLADVIGGRGSHVSRALFPDGRHLPDLKGRGTNGEGAVRIFRVGKKAAGRLLDGRTWDELPATPAGVAS